MKSNQQILSLVVAVALIIYVIITINPQKKTGLDPLKTGPDPLTVSPIVETDFADTTYPIIFEAAYVNQTSVKQDYEYYNFSVKRIGNITLPSGKIIACDPILQFDAEPFEQQFPTGEFPVELALSENEDYQTVAFSRILFSENPVKKWEYALLPGQEFIPLKDSTMYCFSVDAATAIFIDAEANNVFNETEEPVSNLTFIHFHNEGHYNGDIYSFDNYNMARFSSGYGDGCYSTFVGYDSTNQVCRLLIDFGLVRWWE